MQAGLFFTTCGYRRRADDFDLFFVDQVSEFFFGTIA
jgi:hypothetical protein